MATITLTTPLITGTTSNGTAASPGGDAIPNPRGGTIIRVNNGGGSSINVTLTAQQTSRPGDGTFPSMTLANQVIAVPAGSAKYIGPIPPAFNDANGSVQVSYSATTSVTVEAIPPTQ